MSISEKEKQTSSPIQQAHWAEGRGDAKVSHQVWKAHLGGLVGSQGEDTDC